MRRRITLLCLLCVSLACQLVELPGDRLVSRFTSPATTPAPTVTLTPVPTVTVAATATPEISNTPTLTYSATPVDLAPGARSTFTLRYHPDGGLFVGDLVSLEVVPPPGLDVEGRSVSAVAAGVALGAQSFTSFGLGGQPQATYYWSWDTRGLQPGAHTLSFNLLPEGPSWTDSVTLQPPGALPPPEPQARWASLNSDCCQVYFITHTAADRDIEALMEMVEEQARLASQALNSKWDAQLPVVFVPRVLGHGGFTTKEVSLSYLDRDYTGGSAGIILRHEMIHLLDGRLGGDYRPSLFIEGLAVYLSGGHFKPEDTPARAAAVLQLGWYLPLASLTEDFYLAQHEVSYIEAGALVAYMVARWGWEEFNAFYRAIPAPSAEEINWEVIDRHLSEFFNISLDQLEADFLDDLRSREVTAAVVEDVRQSVSFYDALRRYQQALDPSAYFLTAWMLDSEQMRSRGVVADYLRHPAKQENLALETLLVSAASAVRQGEFAHAGERLEAVNAVLAAFERGAANPFTAHPLATDYYTIVGAATDFGYQVQRLEVDGDQAVAWVSRVPPLVEEVQLIRQAGSQWVVEPGP